MPHISNSESSLNENEGRRASHGPDPEVVVKPSSRRFTAEYKQRILKAAAECPRGEVGLLLRREGLYSSHLTNWRQQRDEAERLALAPQPRGRKPDPQAAEIAQLKREVERLQTQLQRAEMIMDVQKKLSELLGLPPTLPNAKP